MPNTSVKATFNFTDKSIISDTNISAANNSDFADYHLINKETKPIDAFMTLEHNINILDGTLISFDKDKDKLAYFSKTLSSDNAIANTDIILTFSKSYTIPGITFNFIHQNRINMLTISYFSGTSTLNYNIYVPISSADYFFNHGSENVNKIKIHVESTRFPRMFVCIQDILLGINFFWSENDIIECEVFESVHPISANLPINTCEITIYSEKDEFNISNPNNFTRYLNKYYEFYIYGEYENNTFLLGKYYLDTWDATKSHEIKFKLISVLGLLEQIKYTDGGIIELKKISSSTIENIFRAYTFSEVIENLFNSYNQSGNVKLLYNISNSIKNFKLIGKTTFDTYRNVLQLICFCANAAVYDTLESGIKLFRPDDYDIKELDNSIIFENQSLKANEVISNSIIKLWVFDGAPDNETFTKLKESEYLIIGNSFTYITDKLISRFQFKAVTSSTWSDYNLNKAGVHKVNFISPATDTYEFRVSYFSEEYNNLEYSLSTTNNNKNTISIDNAFLITDYLNILPNDIKGVYGDLNAFVANIKKYYIGNKYSLEFDFVNDGTIRAGDRLKVPLEIGGYFNGIVVEQRIDASGGMISHIKMVGDINGS